MAVATFGSGSLTATATATATADTAAPATATSIVSIAVISGGATAAVRAVRMPMGVPLPLPTPTEPPLSAPSPVARLLFPLDPNVRCAVLNNFGQQRSGYVHEGEDIAAAEGTPVLAVVDGTLGKRYVADTPTTQLSGNGWRLVSSADHAYYFYAHLQALQPGLAVGSVVHRGDLLGWVGHTGDAGVGNDHLHFEVHPDGLYDEVTDPLPLLDVPAKCTVYPPQR